MCRVGNVMVFYKTVWIDLSGVISKNCFFNIKNTKALHRKTQTPELFCVFLGNCELMAPVGFSL